MQECPGDLICVDDLCCPTDDPCGDATDDAGDDGGGDGDAREPAFTDFGPYDCPEANTEILLHFDDKDMGQYDDLCGKSETTSQLMPFDVASTLGVGVNLNKGNETNSTRHVEATTDFLTMDMSAFTVDALLENPSTPNPDDLAVIASAATFDSVGNVLNGVFILSLREDRRLRLDLFSGAACTAPINPVFSTTELPRMGVTHVRVTVQSGRAEIYLDGFLDAVSTDVGTPCTGINSMRMPALQIRLGGVRVQGGGTEIGPYVRAATFLDEFRLSNIARQD